MTPKDRLERTRRLVSVAVAVTAGGWGLATSVASVALLAVSDTLVMLDRAVRVPALIAALSCGAAVTLVRLWRARRVRSRIATALWVEERVPALGFNLVTAADPSVEATPAVRGVVAGTSWEPIVRRDVARRMARPLVVLAAAVYILLLTPQAAVRRVMTPGPGDVLNVPGRQAAGESALEHVVITVTPPAYSGNPRAVLEDPARVVALGGSSVLVEGRSGSSAVRGRLGHEPVPVRQADGRWSAALSMPGEPALLTLTDAVRERLVALEPVLDSAPRVTLLAPARDSVLRGPVGRIALEARAADDFALTSLWFEVIISSGEGETFRFRTSVLGRRTVKAAEASVRSGLALDSLALRPGDILHLRAVARDNNQATGPSTGASATRTLRIARADEYDSVAVDAAAPVLGDTSALSQRMLIILAQALERRRPSLPRPTVVSESRGIGRDQARLRRQVADLVFLRLGAEPSGEETRGGTPDSLSESLSPEQLLRAAEQAAQAQGQVIDFDQAESPILAINRPLLEAYNAMWDAGRELDSGEPGRALPHMRAALAAIQQARQAERIYLRGRPPAVVADLARVRLTGDRSSAAAAHRRPGPHAPSIVLARRFMAALSAGPRGDPALTDSLLVLRVEALDLAPAFADAVAEAVARLRGGQDATASLLAAQRALGAAVTHIEGLPVWEPMP